MTNTKTYLLFVAAVIVGLVCSDFVGANDGIAVRQVVVQQQLTHSYPSVYYKVDRQTQFDALADAVAERVLAKLNARLADADGNTKQPSLSGQPTDNKLQQLVNAKCVNCHNGINENSERMNLTDVTKLDDSALLDVTRQSYKGNMPKNGAKLTDEEVGVIVHYLMTL